MHTARSSTATRWAALFVGAAALASVGSLTGCAVARDQSTVGAFVDDSAITAAVKARFAEAKTVDATAISVETLNGTVLLTGFAKNATEKSDAESLARGVKHVKAVTNRIVLRG